MPKTVTLYTDGACSGNPGPGGWGALLMYGDIKKELSGGEPDTTNNRMELTAAIEGLHALKYPCIVELYTDSAYLCNAFLNGWIWGWQKNNWKKADKKPVLNVDLWQELIDLSHKHTIHWHKVKGHADNEYNNRCDELARAAIDKVCEEIPCEDDVKIYVSVDYANGLGAWDVIICNNSAEEEFSGSDESLLRVSITALTKAFSYLSKSYIIGLYYTNDAIANLINSSSRDKDISSINRLYELLSAHDIRLHKQEFAERDKKMKRCDDTCRKLLSDLSVKAAKRDGKLFVKLFFAATAKEKGGAWYSIITDGKIARNMSGKYMSQTQNYLRLTAILESLESLSKPCAVEIHTDSMYIYKTATTRIPVWQKNDWLKANKQPVSHADMWQKICELSSVHDIYWVLHEKDDTDDYMAKCRAKLDELLN